MNTRHDIILKAWNGAWGSGDLASFEQILAPSYIRRSKTGPEDFAKLQKTIQAMHAAFPDSTIEILQIVEDGDRAAIHWQTRGTHQGPYMEVPATGRSVTVSGASFLRFENDKLAEEWVVWDPRELLSAVGIWHLGTGN